MKFKGNKTAANSHSSSYPLIPLSHSDALTLAHSFAMDESFARLVEVAHGRKLMSSTDFLQRLPSDSKTRCLILVYLILHLKV